MMTCDLCPRTEAAPTRRAGLMLCTTCVTPTPTRLEDYGVEVAVDHRGHTFAAQAAIHGLPNDLHMRFVPQGMHHTLLKWVVDEVEVGDPTFDDAVYVKTNDPERTATLLGDERVQSVLLGLLVGLRSDQLAPSHVTVRDGSLTVRCTPRRGLGDGTLEDLHWYVAGLAMHLRRHLVP